MAKVKEKERIVNTERKEQKKKKERKEQRLMYNRTPLDYQLIPLQKFCRPEVSVMILFKVLKGKKLQLYHARVSVTTEGEIKNFSEKQKLKEFTNTK